MGYLFLSAALFFGLTKGFCGKKMGNVAANITSAQRVPCRRSLVSRKLPVMP